jgi:hypothetical protein
MNESEKHFSLIRAALRTCGRAKNQIQFSYDKEAKETASVFRKTDWEPEVSERG